MKILNINVTYGPNRWSVKRHRLVVMELDIGDLEYRPTNEIEGFYDRLKNAFMIITVRKGIPEGFFYG